MEPKFTIQNVGWNAEPNSPNPEIKVDGQRLTLEFNANPWAYPGFKNQDKILLSFENCTKYRIGNTNDEGWYLGQCRFSKMAPSWGEFYEIEGETLDGNVQDWIKLLDNSKSKNRHFLFYFRDETFECKADSWSKEIVSSTLE